MWANLIGLIGDANPERPADLRSVTRVQRLGRVAQRLELEAAMDVEVRPDRHGGQPADAEEAKLVVDPVELVVVAHAQANLHRNRERCSRSADAGRNAKLEIPAAFETPV